jgi:hypothetical protein
MALGWRRSDDTSIRVLPAAYRGNALHAANRHAQRRRRRSLWRRLFGR